MNTLDIILLIPILIGAFKGYKKGLIMELIAIAALILAISGGFKLLQTGITFLEKHFGEFSNYLPFIAFIGIFIGILLLIHMLGKTIKKVVDMTIIGSLDNLAGSILGILKWTFAISVVLWLFTTFGIVLPENYVEGSLLHNKVVGIAPWVTGKIGHLLPFVKDTFEAIKELIGTSA